MNGLLCADVPLRNYRYSLTRQNHRHHRRTRSVPPQGPCVMRFNSITSWQLAMHDNV